jgi:hypothetical protein
MLERCSSSVFLEFGMRVLLAVIALSVCLWPLAGLHAGSADDPQPTTVPPPKAPAPIGDSADAARHAKRTACIKEARAKKLLGAEKAQFIRDCVAAP